MLTPENAKHDELEKSKQDFVSNKLKNMPRFNDGGCPFKDKRKQAFKGMVQLENGAQYQGCWITDNDGEEVIHGKGVYVYPNGSQYVGYFYEGEIVGRGRLVFYNGDYYEGGFENQQYSGEGKYFFGESHPVEGFYQGTFKDNKITGDGRMQVRAKKTLTKLFGDIQINESG